MFVLPDSINLPTNSESKNNKNLAKNIRRSYSDFVPSKSMQVIDNEVQVLTTQRHSYDGSKTDVFQPLHQLETNNNKIENNSCQLLSSSIELPLPTTTSFFSQMSSLDVNPAPAHSTSHIESSTNYSTTQRFRRPFVPPRRVKDYSSTDNNYTCTVNNLTSVLENNIDMEVEVSVHSDVKRNKRNPEKRASRSPSSSPVAEVSKSGRTLQADVKVGRESRRATVGSVVESRCILSPASKIKAKLKGTVRNCILCKDEQKYSFCYIFDVVFILLQL